MSSELSECAHRGIATSPLNTSKELASALAFYDEVINKTKSELLRSYPHLPKKANKSKLIPLLVGKPRPGSTTKKKLESLILSTRKEEIQAYLSAYLWWDNLDLQKKLLSHSFSRPIPPEVRSNPPKKLKIKISKGSVYHKNSISFAKLKEEINSQSFLSGMYLSISNLLSYKLKRYQAILEDLRIMYHSLEKRIEQLKKNGLDYSTIKDLYPIHPYILSHIISIEEIIVLITKRAATLSKETIHQNLHSALHNKEKGISSLVGREEIKDIIATQIYSLSSGCFIFTHNFNNIRIYGDPGIGKTTLAKVIGFVFATIGVLIKGNVKCSSRVDFIGQYIGQTAPKTVNLLMETLESVLFIDEAHQLTANTGTNDFGDEAITEIVNFTDKYIGLSIVIVAGYKDQMVRDFMPSNKGLYRRFPYLYSLTRYTPDELTSILIKKLGDAIAPTIKIDKETTNFLSKIILELEKEYLKDQAGDMLNLSACISKAISSAYNIKWENHNLENNRVILLEGINDFLAIKGVVVNIEI